MYVIQKEAERKLKYKKNLSIGIQGMWNTKCLVIPVITVVTGIATKGPKKSVNNTRKEFNRVYKKNTAVLGTSHIVR
jgi:hypothetical protein